MALFSSSRPGIRGRVLTRFPSRVLATGGLSVTKANGVYTFSNAYDDVAAIVEVAAGDEDNTFFLVYNSLTDTYRRLSVEALLDGLSLTLDDTLLSLADYNTNGFLVQTAADTFAGRTITAATGLAVTNGSGVSGNPSVALDINSLSIDASPDGTNDYLVSWDASASAHKKISITAAASVVSAPSTVVRNNAELVAAVAASAISIRVGASFVLTTAITLPAFTTLDLGGYIIYKGANIDMFTMSASTTIMNGRIDGEGGSPNFLTGRGIVISSGSNQRLVNVDIVDMHGYNVEFTVADVGWNFIWDGGSFNRTTAALDAIKLPASEDPTGGLRNFSNLAGNGSAMIDLSGGRLTRITNCAMASMTFGTLSAYAQLVNVRSGLALTVYGDGHYLTNVLHSGSGSLTIGLNATNCIVEKQALITVVDNSNNGTNLVRNNNLDGRNLIFWGNFATNPWQRGTSFGAVASGTYTADRMRWAQVGTGVVSISRIENSPSIVNAGIYTKSELYIDVTGTDPDNPLAATDLYVLQTAIEGYDLVTAGWGQSGALPLFLEFWVISEAITGTHCVSFRNSAANLHYVAEYSITNAGFFERKTIVVPGPTSGTWESTTSLGVNIGFCIGAGADYHTSANAWTAGSKFATSNQTNRMNSTANNIAFANIRAYIGGVKGPEDTRGMAEVLHLCRRTCVVADTQVPAGTAQNLRTLHMRATPTITGGGTGFSSAGTTKDSLIGFQSGDGTQTLTLAAELA